MGYGNRRIAISLIVRILIIVDNPNIKYVYIYSYITIDIRCFQVLERNFHSIYALRSTECDSLLTPLLPDVQLPRS